MTCISGPPITPGKTAESSSSLIIFGFPLFHVLPSGFSLSFPMRSMPPRGPRSVLCVVVETTWAWGSGSFSRSAAMRPAVWAMSTQRIAPTSSAIARNAS